jgi:hypothetical protein
MQRRKLANEKVKPRTPVVKKKSVVAKKAVKAKNGGRSAIRIKYDVGFNNNLYIRGEGAGLDWGKGSPLTNVARDEWIWETTEPFETCQFKVLINDKEYELGENHRLPPGATVQYTPQFRS